jgi:hypothetical protein
MFKYIIGNQSDFKYLPDTALIIVRIDGVKYYSEMFLNNNYSETELINIKTGKRCKKYFWWGTDGVKLIAQREIVTFNNRCSITLLPVTLTQRYKKLMKSDPELVDAIKNNKIFEVGEQVRVKGTDSIYNIIHIDSFIIN